MAIVSTRVGRRQRLPARTRPTEEFAGPLATIRELRVRERFDEAHAEATRLLTTVAFSPVAVALLRNEVGLLLKATGAYGPAREQYERAMRLLPAGDSDEAATILHNLAGIRFVLGDCAGAARCGRRGLAMRRRLRGADDLAVLLDEGNLAPILIALNHDTAERMLDRLLVAFTALCGPDDPEVAVTLTNLGSLAAHQGDWSTARDRLTRAAEIKALRFGPDSRELITTLANLAVVTERAGDPAAAGPVRARAVEIARATLPGSHPLRRHVEGL